MQASKMVLGKLTHQTHRPKPVRVLVLGIAGVGKTALTVRFVTKRYIGEYDPFLEKTYMYHTTMNNEPVDVEILDSAGQSLESESAQMESNIKWADIFILIYAVTDKCSFDECNRLKFLISYNKRRRRLLGGSGGGAATSEVPVILVGNKKDQGGDRMVTKIDGKRRSRDIGCVAFHEISVRESIEEVEKVFEDVFLKWKNYLKPVKLMRTTSDFHHGPFNMDTLRVITSMDRPSLTSTLGLSWTQRLLDSPGKAWPMGLGAGGGSTDLDAPPTKFRDRACTDGNLHNTRKINYRAIMMNYYQCSLSERRMSISMRGSLLGTD